MNDPRYQSKIGGLSTEELSAKLREAMKEVETKFPPGTGIAVFVFDRGVAPGGFGWIANADRNDMIDALVEWIQIQRGRN